ncbi:hypothetical protein TWF102_005119 [Orbilia oligospora]|uniref:Uncharacterized protein n=1 Tax=Orbilia oligospora TaxID=2813651 RepID=A0A7C8JAJ4_ORBOL|nr:hypothetical protein TWF103_009785 [Orbilia oligospora]KAF3100740.1 hypothetical protein TWF102_005119 [Orbilia oligospora]KAF3111863.1 hypothetical protein TWF706_011595 [Orbilia oligospora]
MYFAAIHYGLVAFGLSLTSANASPYYGINVGYSKLQARDLFVDPSTCDDFVIGATNTKVGQVCVGISGGILNVAYGKLNSCTYSSVHVYVGTVPPTDRNPGGFPYSSDPGGICTLSADRTTASCPIPVQNSWRACEQTLYIATHGSVNCNPGGGQTGWGMGTCIGGSNGNCAKYWMFTTHCYCPSSTSIFTSTSTTTFLTSTMVTYTTSTTSEYPTSTTITYTTSTTSTYTTSTTVVYDTSTTSLYTTTQYPETVITSVTTSTLPLSSTTYTLTCTNPRP